MIFCQQAMSKFAHRFVLCGGRDGVSRNVIRPRAAGDERRLHRINMSISCRTPRSILATRWPQRLTLWRKETVPCPEMMERKRGKKARWPKINKKNNKKAKNQGETCTRLSAHEFLYTYNIICALVEAIKSKKIV